jgi:hypothetical protein
MIVLSKPSQRAMKSDALRDNPKRVPVVRLAGDVGVANRASSDGATTVGADDGVSGEPALADTVADVVTAAPVACGTAAPVVAHAGVGIATDTHSHAASATVPRKPVAVARPPARRKATWTGRVAVRKTLKRPTGGESMKSFSTDEERLRYRCPGRIR